jgi:hypothetical protein
MKIATWKEEKYKGEKCPICRYLNQNFPVIKLGDLDVFLCMQKNCGALFVPKYEREEINIKELIEKQLELTCKNCGKVCKNKIGYISHMKSHEKKA